MSEIPLRFRKKEYEPGTDSVDGVVTFDSSEKKIYLDGNVYGAKNIQSDWNDSDTSSESYILNKPTGMAFIGSDYDGESASADSIISNYDFIHTPNTNIGSSSVTVTFAPNQRCTAEYTVSTDISVNIVCNNRADNYIWINNALSTSAVTATLSGITFIGSSVQSIKGATNIPQIPAGGTLEISVVCNSDGAKLASGLL